MTAFSESGPFWRVLSRLALLLPGVLVLLGAACAAATPAPEGKWITRASMQEERSWIAMATVAGKIYAIGGMTGSEGRRLDLNEVYDPVSNSWTQRAPMPTARSSPGTAVVGNTIYVMGGYPEDAPTGRVEAYDTAADRWITDLPPMPTRRFDLTAVAWGNVIYTFGGYNNGPLNVVEAYDTATHQWSTLAPMPTARYALQAVIVNRLIYVLGGHAQDATDVVEALDPVTRQWTRPTWLPEPMAGFGATMAEGLVHVVKYDKHFAYDPNTGRWQTKLAPMPTSRHGLRLAYIDGLIYAVGGCLPDGNNLFDVARNEAFVLHP